MVTYLWTADLQWYLEVYYHTLSFNDGLGVNMSKKKIIDLLGAQIDDLKKQVETANNKADHFAKEYSLGCQTITTLQRNLTEVQDKYTAVVARETRVAYSRQIRHLVFEFKGYMTPLLAYLLKRANIEFTMQPHSLWISDETSTMSVEVGDFIAFAEVGESVCWALYESEDDLNRWFIFEDIGQPVHPATTDSLTITEGDK
jgi:hypothetical protein